MVLSIPGRYVRIAPSRDRDAHHQVYVTWAEATAFKANRMAERRERRDSRRTRLAYDAFMKASLT
jgi:hypothetical protein